MSLLLSLQLSYTHACLDIPMRTHVFTTVFTHMFLLLSLHMSLLLSLHTCLYYCLYYCLTHMSLQLSLLLSLILSLLLSLLLSYTHTYRVASVRQALIDLKQKCILQQLFLGVCLSSKDSSKNMYVRQ